LRVAIVGGGISGLAAAWELRGSADVTLFEPVRLGGKILTEPFEGRLVEAGPDAFITRLPDAVALCRQVGLDDLVAPAAGGTLLWHQERLRALPDGLILGVPRRLAPLATSGLLSPAGMIRAAADLVLPRTDIGEDVSVRALVASRFGRQVADGLVDPLIGSIYAGRTAELSAVAAVPQLVEAARQNRSLLIGLRRTAPDPQAGPPFLAPREGLGALVSRLVAGIRQAGADIVAAPVASVIAAGNRWRVDPTGDEFDGVILATPAANAAELLGPDAPPGLGQMRRASVALATLGYPSLELPSGINGFLVPANTGWLMTACSFGSSKWPHWAQPGRSLLRVSAGRAGDTRHLELDDAALVDRLAGEVATALRIGGRPESWRVNRWPDSFPQYDVGHPARVRAIFDQLRRTHAGLQVCGASYSGVGIPACIASGRGAARGALARTEAAAG
jgi:oxygen-dependent protoporphyrinogen oxidase